jgi:hypothetical protein
MNEAQTRRRWLRRSKRLPTDLEILDAIYNRYYDVFAAYEAERSGRRTKVYVPIDSAAIATELGVDPDIVFGRLHFYLEQRHGYRKSDGVLVPLFTNEVEETRWTVNFPYLASVLAGLRQERRQHSVATWIAVVALIISVIALFI